MERPRACRQAGHGCYLFIYLVRRGASEVYRYCTVVVYGPTLAAAEDIAINRVHQEGLHIVRADTATPAPWLDPSRDGDFLTELARYGSSLRLSDWDQTGRPATAA